MEFDFQNPLNYNDGVEISEGTEKFSTNYEYFEDNQSSVSEAKIVYILMPKNVPVSRANRLQWLLDHLNKIITVPNIENINNSSNLEIISVVPREQNSVKCNKFKVTYRTEVKYFAHAYKFIYCLDMSPSQSIIDIQKGEILFDEVLQCFRTSAEAICREFTIPGSSVLFQPTVYLTVIVNTPFIMTLAQQVIVKGVQLSMNNFKEIIDYVEEQFYLLEDEMAKIAALVSDQIEDQTVQNERIVGGLFDLPDSEKYSKIPMVTPDVNFVNMLRYCMLAISLLPENCLSHILVITDGIVAMPDSNIMESLLFQLHYDSVAVSFLKVGSNFHPHASAGYVSYTDLLYFLAQSTLGTCLENCPDINLDSSMNMYQELFMLWSFYSVHKYAYPKYYSNKWISTNESFCNHKPPSLLSKRQSDENTSASLLLLLARRMREGFTVDNLSLINGNLEIKLSLQWKSFIYIHYKISSQWPVLKNHTRFELYISAPYEFLHDITCMIKKETKSLYRQAIIERFWSRISQLSTGDLGLAQQISSFQFNKDWYSLPETVRSGVPVYILNNSSYYSDSARLVLTPRDASCSKFINIWQPICQLETCNWRRWLHVHKISLILKHDSPLPKYLHLPNSSSKRFQVVQCRQAAAALYKMLAEWGTFILIDNHTYLRLLYKEKDKPFSFCIVRVSAKFPCVVLNIGFATNTPGEIRYETCEELKSELSTLSYLASSMKTNENFCCVLLHKPIEKILIRYDRNPSNFTTLVFPDGTQPLQSTLYYPSHSTGPLFTTLSRYLYHKRWIWSASHSSNLRLAPSAIARILNTITRLRLDEGFNFAHSSSGIITMVLELKMDSNFTCIVQYVLFPPYCAYWRSNEESCSGSEEENEHDIESEMQMVTEIWIEPQYGQVQPNNSSRIYLNNKHYHEVADVISRIDLQCINSLLTMEHLSVMCQNKSKENANFSFNTNNDMSMFNHKNSNDRKGFVRRNSRNSCIESPALREKGFTWVSSVPQRIEHIPFNFDPISILPLCQKTELLFSMFIESKDNILGRGVNSINTPNDLLLLNILKHLSTLHDEELILTKVENDNFTKQVINQHLSKPSHICPIFEKFSRCDKEDFSCNWRCFMKGISITHVILTFVPSTLEDLMSLMIEDDIMSSNVNSSFSSNGERTSSRGSSYSDVPINFYSNNALSLPIYVFDCPLALLVNAYIANYDSANDDVYEDHKYRSFTDYEEEDCIRLNEDGDDSKNEESSESPELSSVKRHCRTLVLVHSRCYTLTLFLSLHFDLFVHSYDVQSAMDQCEESFSEIDITDYLMTVCGHMKNTNDNIAVQNLKQYPLCGDLKPLHMLIKEKFLKIINEFFYTVPSNNEYYYYRNLLVNKASNVVDSDDETSSYPENVEFQSGFGYKDESVLFQGLDSCIDYVNADINPLFLHFICTLRFNNEHSNTTVSVLPTCLGELIDKLENSNAFLDKSKLQVTLDILCLTLPPDVQNIILEYSKQGLRTTSFCSDVFQPSIGGSTFSDGSFSSEPPEPLMYLPEYQKKSIIFLREEIKWLLQDEIATALLDVAPVTSNILNFIIKHVTDSNYQRSSCILQKIDLNFVYPQTEGSFEKFSEEFAGIELPFYKFCKKDDLFYLAKCDNLRDIKTNIATTDFLSSNNDSFNSDVVFANNNEFNPNLSHLFETSSDNENTLEDFNQNKDDIGSIHSDLSIANSLGMFGPFDEELSEEENFNWINNLQNKREHLPNFWLIAKLEYNIVTIYFHCRFLELSAIHKIKYLQTQTDICDAIKRLCKRFNQLLLLQSLYDSRICLQVLEPDDKYKDSNEDYEYVANSELLSEPSSNFKVGDFSCPVVWQTEFYLNPRLKTGPGKSGISRGILALKSILDKFSVSNRNNMFVYRDKNFNVFYLRLHENIRSLNKSTNIIFSEFENITVSRSPSIASLPIGKNQNNLTPSEQSASFALSNDIRPRVRSFGEKECKDDPHQDAIILSVHGITDAGTDVKCELVQVLQNRLDDAVLECLSIMLSRNALCPLTPSDVQFIQKPFKPPEFIVKLTIQEYGLQHIDAFIHYLKQNLLQFINIPKYTDTRTHLHFKDYSETDDSNNRINRIGKDNIFIYNQSQNPSSGNRGIACIALSIVYNNDNTNSINLEESINDIFEKKNFEHEVESLFINEFEEKCQSYLEFRIWKQGRVNTENLSQKLRAAACQASWDIMMEYGLLKKPLCVENSYNPISKHIFEIDTTKIDYGTEIMFNCNLDFNFENKINERITTGLKRKLVSRKQRGSKTHKNVDEKDNVLLTPLETGDQGKLCEVYSKFMPIWLEFGNTLNAPAVRKHRINLISNLLPKVTIRELLNLLQDTPKAFRDLATHSLISESNDIFVPHTLTTEGQKYVIISRDFEQWKTTVTMSSEICNSPNCSVSPQKLKHTQKFVPACSPDIFIPRQKILWILIDADGITIYTYNWAKELIDKLIKNCSNLGLWLCVRTCFLNSVTAQKLGLFHNQSLTRKCFVGTNPYINFIGDTESMRDFPRDNTKKRSHSPHSLENTIETFRDHFRNCKITANDPVIVFTIEMREIRTMEKKARDDMKILHAMYQSRASIANASQLALLMDKTRIIHYCHTPLLFLSRWRIKSAATRDHTLFPSTPTQLTDTVLFGEKEQWYTELCYSFFTDYRNYLQTLGFLPLQIHHLQQDVNNWNKDASSYNSVFYIQKTILGGILLFTVEFSEPFFVSKLHAIECSRLQNINLRSSINRFTLSFLDECDRVKIFMHLHSFTYDFHLRCIYNYISNNSGTNKVCERYNVHQFLDDFMKYYNKAPNFARNLVHTDTLTIPNLITEGKQLYEYLLSNIDKYNFKACPMDVFEGEQPEYILVQVTSTPQVSYKDFQDIHHTDDFDVTLIVYNLCTPFVPSDNVLHLKYYLILTSKREVYPKSEVEHELGKFRTVSSTGRSISTLEQAPIENENTANNHTNENSDVESEMISSSEHNYSFEDKENTIIEPQSLTSIPHIEICQESVNYLGYYSSHEQLMQQLILEKACTTQKRIKDIVSKGMVHCRTHLLWNRLISPQENALNYNEFIELKNLAKLAHLCDLHPNLGPLLNQPLLWYQGLAKLLLIKYVEQNRSFISSDGNIQHYVILHPRYLGAFMLLSIDLHTSRGELYAVYREPHKQEEVEVCLAYQKSLLDGFVNCICFYLWSGMISS